MVVFFYMKENASERMVPFGYEDESIDGQRDGCSQMGRNDGDGTGGEHKESDGSGEEKEDGDAEGEAVGSRQESGARPLGFVYFVETQDGQFIKIGHSRRPRVRMGELRAAQPGALRMIGCVSGTEQIESWLHQLFREDRDHGEWFRSSDRLRDLLGLLPLSAPPEIKSPITNTGSKELQCLRCGQTWRSRVLRPKACPNCKQPRWDTLSRWEREQ